MGPLLVRLLLAAVLLTAGIAKLGDREGARRMVTEFGCPAGFATPFTWGLIGAELGVAVALLFGPSAHAGGVGALVLLIGFGAAVATGVKRGRRPVCRCFGRLRANEVGWSTVARDALLATGAGFVVADGQFALAFAAIAAAAAGLWLALGSQTAPALGPGASAPSFSLPDLAGRTWTLESLLGVGSPLLLVFSQPGCGACQELIPELARWQEQAITRLTTVVVSSGMPEQPIGDTDEHRVGPLLLDQAGTLASLYGLTATPSAVLVGASGKIVAAPALGAEQIAVLITRAEDATFARRAVLTRAAVGVASITVGPLIESATAAARTVKHAARPRKLKIDGAWLCNQRYALCTSAACTPSKSNPNISICKCKITTGYSVGFKTCEQRAPAGRRLHSNFSLQDVTDRTHTLKCSKRGLWVQCLDMVCEIDPRNPGHASCQCANMTTKNFYTFGGDCDTKTCSTVIWSATSAPFPGGAQYEKGLRRLGVPFKVPKRCPTKEA